MISGVIYVFFSLDSWISYAVNLNRAMWEETSAKKFKDFFFSCSSFRETLNHLKIVMKI